MVGSVLSISFQLAQAFTRWVGSDVRVSSTSSVREQQEVAVRGQPLQAWRAPFLSNMGRQTNVAPDKAVDGEFAIHECLDYVTASSTVKVQSPDVHKKRCHLVRVIQKRYLMQCHIYDIP